MMKCMRMMKKMELMTRTVTRMSMMMTDFKDESVWCLYGAMVVNQLMKITAMQTRMLMQMMMLARGFP